MAFAVRGGVRNRRTPPSNTRASVSPLGFPFLRSPSLSQSAADPPSLWSVSMLFHLACCYRGLGAGRLQLASQSFSIYLSSPRPHFPPLRLALAPAGINPHTHTHTQPFVRPSFHFSPSSTPSSLFDWHGNLARKLRDKKEI